MTIANDTEAPGVKQGRAIARLLDFALGAALTICAFLAGVNMTASMFGVGFMAQEGEWTPFLVFVAALTLSRAWWADSKAGQEINKAALQAAAREAAVTEVARQLDHNFAERVLVVIREANLRGDGWFKPPPS